MLESSDHSLSQLLISRPDRVLKLVFSFGLLMVLGCQQKETPQPEPPDSNASQEKRSQVQAQRAENSQTPQKVMVLEHPNFVFDAIFSPDGKRVVSNCFGETVYVWDAATGEQTGTPIDVKKMDCLLFGEDSDTLIVGNQDGALTTYDLVTGQKKGELFKDPGPVMSAALSSDGQRIVIGGIGSTQVWDLKTGQPVSQKFSHLGPGAEVAFSPDGKTIAVGGWLKKAFLWDLSPKHLPEKTCVHKGSVTSVTFSPDGKLLLTTGDILNVSDSAAKEKDSTVHLWDVETGKSLGDAFQHQDSILDLAFSPDGKSVITSSADQTAMIWDFATRRPVAGPLKHEGFVSAVAFSPDGKFVLTACSDQTVRIWEVATLSLSEEAAKYDLEKLKQDLK
ncbi:WD40 repeat domain-containing protein [Gimesia panareensis]|uniref:WD40 repeat domain-containing protein n=1 Tax=Gimesia panareensis TaxID=2527978 RepID=UPI00118A6778|nr:WD40 repeat domain-containing protein [Gimesia panareensis]QDU49139.1 translocation protein TolB [Gimesia panareensis]